MVEKRKAHNIALTLDVKERLKEINDHHFVPMGISLSYNQIIKHILSVYDTASDKKDSSNQLDMFDEGKEVAHSYVEEETAVLEQRSDDKPFEEPYDETV